MPEPGTGVGLRMATRDAEGQAGGVVRGPFGDAEDQASEGLGRATRPGARGPARRGVG